MLWVLPAPRRPAKQGTQMATTTHDLGNNETARIGVVKSEGEFLALTLTASRTFKTYRAAVAWLASRGYTPCGCRVAS